MSQADIFGLTFLYIYRLIGVGLFIGSGDESFLLIFADFYIYIALLLAIIYQFPALEKYRSLLFILVILLN